MRCLGRRAAVAVAVAAAVAASVAPLRAPDEFAARLARAAIPA
eukprot:CAMPEP_0185283310 /NCGR_PEP_ID=MMETSP1363-20130426/336_1 /TAXON_ID=38817 /ORGANISM="Gephyrocapsa oceanica, Strain RCC1303" /LENGTH=42 /DNA_ID= /DNA_START= /DNA_END= /DNA_ORIENTATION=